MGCPSQDWATRNCAFHLLAYSLPCWLWWNKLPCWRGPQSKASEEQPLANKNWILPTITCTWKQILSHSRLQMKPQPWLTPWLQLCDRCAAKDPSKLCLKSWPYKLWNNKHVLFEAAKFMVICYGVMGSLHNLLSFMHSEIFTMKWSYIFILKYTRRKRGGAANRF